MAGEQVVQDRWRTYEIVALTLAAVSPLAGVATPLLGYDMPRFAAVLLVGAMCAPLLVLAASRGTADRSTRLLLIATTGAAVAVLASAAFAAWPATALAWGAEASAMSAPVWVAGLVVFSVAALCTSGRAVRATLGAAAALGIVLAVWALSDLAQRGFTGAGFGNGNYAGAILALLAPVTLAAALMSRSSSLSLGLRLSAGLAALAAALSGSAAVFAAVILELVAVVLLVPGSIVGSDPTRVWWVRRVIVGGVAVLLAVFLLALVPGVMPAPVSAFATDAVAGPSVRSRLAMWETGTRTWMTHPVLGVGPDGLAVASQPHITDELMLMEGARATGDRMLPRDPHSLPVLLLVSFGLVGALAFGFLGARWAMLLRERLRADKGASRDIRLLMVVASAGFVAALLFVPATVRFALVPALVMGLAVSPLKASQSAGRATAKVAPVGGRAIHVVAWAAVAVLAAVFLGIAVLGVAGEYRLQRSEDATSTTQRVALLESASRLQPGRALLPVLVVQTRGLELLSGQGSFEAFASAVKELPASTSALGPYDALLAEQALDYAWLSGDERALDLGTELAGKGVKLSPNTPQTVIEAAHAAVLSQDVIRAREHLDRAAALGYTEPRIALYQYGLSVASGDDAQADALAQQLSEKAPELAGFIMK